jgi:Rieske Fe-S protein
MASLRDSLAQGLSFPKKFVSGRMKSPNNTVDNLSNGEGAIINVRGKKTAVYKSQDGTVTALSPICKHFACIVEWNQVDTTWDCPCHGSRYRADGTLMRGPAKKDLDKVSLSS